MAPSDEDECRKMLTTAFRHDGPSAVRYPRGSGTGVVPEKALTVLPLGKGVVRREGKRVAFLAFGAMVQPALAAAEVLDATVADMRFVKPLDLELVKRLAATHDLLVTVEEHQVMAGAGGAVCEALANEGSSTRVLLLGLPDRFIDHGDPAKLLASLGLDRDGLVKAVQGALRA